MAQKLYFNAPGVQEIQEDRFAAQTVAALDRAVDLGAMGVRAGMNPFTVEPEDPVPTGNLTSYIEACVSRGLALHLLFYPFADDVTEGWQALYGGIWNEGRDGPPPNQFRPPAGASNVVWAEIARQCQVMITAAHDQWVIGGLPESMLTFEFGNEPWCGAAWGLQVGVSTQVMGSTVNIAFGQLDNAFHDLAQYMIEDYPLGFHGHRVFGPTMASFAEEAELDSQIETMFYADAGLTYRAEFDGWGFNVYPRIQNRQITGSYTCRADVVRRAVTQIVRMRSGDSVDFIGEKPLAIAETGVSAFLGGFQKLDGSIVPQFGRPYWYQEQGRYLAADLRPLLGLGVERVGVFTLVEPPMPDDPGDDWFINEGSYGLMDRDLDPSDNVVHRGSLFAFGSGFGRIFEEDLTWTLRTEAGEVWLSGAPD